MDSESHDEKAKPRRPQSVLSKRPIFSGGYAVRREAPAEPASTDRWLHASPNVDNIPGPVRQPAPSNVDKKTTQQTKPVRMPEKAAVSHGFGLEGLAAVDVKPPNVDNISQGHAAEEMVNLPAVGGPWHRLGAPHEVGGGDGAVGGGVLTPGLDMERFGELRKAVADRLSERMGDRLAPAGILGAVQGSTRTAATVAAYERRGRQLENRYRKWINVDQAASINPIEFSTWVLAQKTKWTASAWRTYKQAAIHVLTRIEHGDSEEARHMLDREAGWDVEMAIKSKKSTGRVTATGRNYVDSATKAKDFDYQDFLKLDAYLQVKVWSKHAQPLRDWLRAGLATGLRPDEWQATEVSTWYDSQRGVERTFLFVANAKATNGRANGTVRTLDITNFSNESMNAVMRMSERGREWSLAGNFDDMQDRCAQMLYRADDKLWPKRTTRTYALYSCRHQFTLNMRSIERTEVEISALLGHVVTDTQLSHYGKRGRGWSIDKIIDRPAPIESEVSTVRKRLDIVTMQERLDDLIEGRKPKQKSETEYHIGDPDFGGNPSS